MKTSPAETGPTPYRFVRSGLTTIHDSDPFQIGMVVFPDDSAATFLLSCVGEEAHISLEDGGCEIPRVVARLNELHARVRELEALEAKVEAAFDREIGRRDESRDPSVPALLRRLRGKILGPASDR